MLSYGVLNYSDQQIHDFLAGLLTLCLTVWILYLLLRSLRRSRPDLAIGAPIAAAFAIRVIAALGVSSTGIASTLRGGDEYGFFVASKAISNTPFLASGWTSSLTGKLYEFVFSSQILALDSTQTILRISQAGIAVAGLALLATAVYQLAGRRAALIAAWVLAIEPANVFFSTLLHKEPLMFLAGGLVAVGGANMWKTAKIQYLWPIAIGCLIAVATRPYAGWFLIAAGAAITLHVGLRARGEHGQGARSLTLVAVVVLLGAISAPTIWKASTHESLSTLQLSQTANAENNSNLKLEQVDFSTRGAIIVNLPKRISDVLTRPYPWQVSNTSQQLGLLGTIFAWTIFFFLAGELWRARGHIMERAGPLVYTSFFLLIAYSLSAGNAGTAFRYRTHVVAFALCTLIVLRELRLHPAAVPEPAAVGRQPVPEAPSLAGA
jgi:hypothetical protein